MVILYIEDRKDWHRANHCEATEIPEVLDLHARQSLIHIPGLFDYRPGRKRRYRQLSYHHK